MSNPTLTQKDLARLVIACQDNAHHYYGHEFGDTYDSAASYVTDVLHRWTMTGYEAHTIRDAVDRYLAGHPDVLTYTAEQVRLNRRKRANDSDDASGEASALWLAGFTEEAHAYVDLAEANDPDHLTAREYSWDRIRRIIDTEGPES